ncbi:MAG: PIN domain-containing protein [Candidatus Saccharimonadales bacterium]
MLQLSKRRGGRGNKKTSSKLMIVVDTNYLVRLFTNQPKQQTQTAIMDLARCEPGQVILPDFVVSELFYVLQFHDKLTYSRHEIIEGLRLILDHPAWKLDHELHQAAIQIYEDTKLDYVDCLVRALYDLKRVQHVFTFDKAMKKNHK